MPKRMSGKGAPVLPTRAKNRKNGHKYMKKNTTESSVIGGFLNVLDFCTVTYYTKMEKIQAKLNFPILTKNRKNIYLKSYSMYN